MMDWVPAFYARQYELLDDAGAWEIQPIHRERAISVQELVAPPARVLELGAGGGQVAAALADLGYSVVANELLSQVGDRAQELAKLPRAGEMTVVRGDFYEIELDGTFDVICYWDGFGIGTDSDQRALLRRVRTWLAKGGRALIEIYTPWYWAQAVGRSVTLGKAARQYDFDGYGNRMLDTWWRVENPASAFTQSLRCYAPSDLKLLLEGTGLQLVGVMPGGHYDAATDRYEAEAPLERAMSYVATLVPGP